jgi:glucan 1,3-beta-glucosidase
MWQFLSLSSAIWTSFVLIVLSSAQFESPLEISPARQRHAVNQKLLAPDREGVAASGYWLDEQDHTGNARGYAPFLGTDFTYPVYRNVRAYGAAGNGNNDDTNALQNAINTDGKGGTRYRNEVTTRPAEVFVPGGTYKISKTIDLRLNTILIGDPNDRPIFKASPDFSGDSLINGYDFATDGSAGTTNFLVAVKNIVIDTTNINKDKGVIALNWGVAQGCQLTNIRIQMPSNSGGHIGIAIDQGSTISIGDIVR